LPSRDARRAPRYPAATDEVLARWFSAGIAVRRLVVAFCVVVVVVALCIRYPDAFRDANDTARANASLDLIDRTVGAGNSVFPDQRLLVEARGLIPEHDTFAVAIGASQPGWTDLTASSGELFLRSFLLPRRLDPAARWIVCLGCDRSSYPGADVVWEGDAGLSILRRAT
jgi:hypothetical protein